MGASIHEADGTIVRTVKNLGWLRRNRKSVTSFEVFETPTGRYDCIMIARLVGGRYYRTDWASREVCRAWLKRPIFKGCPLTWFGTQTEC